MTSTGDGSRVRPLRLDTFLFMPNPERNCPAVCMTEALWRDETDDKGMRLRGANGS